MIIYLVHSTPQALADVKLQKRIYQECTGILISYKELGKKEKLPFKTEYEVNEEPRRSRRTK